MMAGTNFDVRLPDPVVLASGDVLTEVTLAVETHGRLNHARDNAVLVLHPLTADQHVAGPPLGPLGKPGWWDIAVGDDRPIDTRRFHVICANVIGGAGGSTGPGSFIPGTNRRYGAGFPIITVDDMVRTQRTLLDVLEIERLHATVGGCLGGFQALEWLRQAPARAGRTAIIGATPRTSAQTIALWTVLRAALRADPAWNGGDYYGKPATEGVGLAAMIGILFWMNRATFGSRFGLRTAHPGPPHYSHAPEFDVEVFLDRVRASAHGRLDPNSFITLSRAMDYFDITRDHGALIDVFGGVTAPVLLVSYGSDWRYPPQEVDEIRLALSDAGKTVRHVTLDSQAGHGAFLHDFASLAPVLRTFLTGTA
jgi:homoserine O-acetyltransferase